MIAKTMPAGMTYSIPFDTAPFVKISIEKVIHTLIEAMVLVFLVMYLFLQNVRYTLIPAIVAPVAMLGTFTVMLMTGFDQRADDVRHGARDRHHRRRCDRRRGERRTPDGGRRPVAEGRDDQGHEGNHRRHHRHHAGADGRVPADGDVERLGRRDLPAVHDVDGRVDHVLGPARADADAGPVRDDARRSSTATTRSAASSAGSTAASTA